MRTARVARANELYEVSDRIAAKQQRRLAPLATDLRKLTPRCAAPDAESDPRADLRPMSNLDPSQRLDPTIPTRQSQPHHRRIAHGSERREAAGRIGCAKVVELGPVILRHRNDGDTFEATGGSCP